MDNRTVFEIGEGACAFSPYRDMVLPCRVVEMHQVHGDRIAVVDRPDLTRQDLDGYDALITNLPGVAIGARTADCVPVLLYDKVCRAVAAVHSGWKGTVLGISAKVIRRMSECFGTEARNVRAVIGPSIGPESFQVGMEVAQQFADSGFPMERILFDRGEKVPGSMQGGLHIDLWESNRIILEQAGVPACNIYVSGIDTYSDTRFFSARREGPSCGRTVNVIYMYPPVAH